MEAIRAAGIGCKDEGLRSTVLYSTVQPCGMCTKASIWSKVGRIVYGAGRDDVHRMYIEARAIDTLDFVAEAYHDDISIGDGILRDARAKLYYGADDHVPAEEQGNL